MVHYILILSLLGSRPLAGELETDIRALTQGQKATYGIAFKDLQTGQTLFINQNDVMHAASTMKTPVMIRLFQMIDEGELDSNQLITVKNQFVSIVDGSSFKITVDSEENLYENLGKQLPLMTLIEAMIIHSSNLATNILIQIADAKKTTALMRELGAKDIQVLRGVEDLKAYEANRNNESSAADMLAIMEAIVSSNRFSEKSKQQMWQILARQAYREMIPAGIPKDAKVQIAHKTGSISRVEHDAGVVRLTDGRRYVLVIFSRDFGDESGRKQVHQTAAKISQRIYEEMTSAR